MGRTIICNSYLCDTKLFTEINGLWKVLGEGCGVRGARCGVRGGWMRGVGGEHQVYNGELQ